MKINPRILLAITLFVLSLMLYFGGFANFLSLENLIKYRDLLTIFIANNMVVAGSIYVIVYIITISLSLPGASILTISGGFLFGFVGLPLVLIGATVGAMCNFIAGRYIFGDAIQTKYAEKLAKFNQEVDENGASYLLSLRLTPIFPFFVINLIASVSKIKLSTFVWTTFVGIIPGSGIYWYAGTTLTTIDSTKNILSPNVLIAFTFLAAISVIPIFIKKLKKYVYN